MVYAKIMRKGAILKSKSTCDLLPHNHKHEWTSQFRSPSHTLLCKFATWISQATSVTKLKK